MRSIYLGFLIVYWHNSRVLIPVDTPHLHNKGLLCNTLRSRYVRKQHSTFSPVLKFISVIITRHTKESNQPRLVVFNPSDRTLWIAAPSNSRFLYLVSIVEKRLQIFLFFPPPGWALVRLILDSITYHLHKPSGRSVYKAASCYILAVTTGNKFWKRRINVQLYMKEEASQEKKGGTTTQKICCWGNKETEAVGPPP